MSDIIFPMSYMVFPVSDVVLRLVIAVGLSPFARRVMSGADAVTCGAVCVTQGRGDVFYFHLI